MDAAMVANPLLHRLPNLDATHPPGIFERQKKIRSFLLFFEFYFFLFIFKEVAPNLFPLLLFLAEFLFYLLIFTNFPRFFKLFSFVYRYITFYNRINCFPFFSPIIYIFPQLQLMVGWKGGKIKINTQKLDKIDE